MERIAFLIFSGLEGWSHRLSYQSAGPQVDLLIRGSSAAWYDLFDLLHLDRKKRGILVEAKAIEKVVDDQMFARLCSVARDNLKSQVGLGVFVTINGASGFPKGSENLRKLSDARLRQAIFHARTEIPIVVLTRAELSCLTRPGALVEVLEEKIVEIEQQIGGFPSIAKYKRCELPDHLSKIR